MFIMYYIIRIDFIYGALNHVVLSHTNRVSCNKGGKPGKKRVRKLGRWREESSTVEMGLQCLLEGGIVLAVI